MSRCDEVRVELGGYALGGLTDDELASVEEHLQRCHDCRDEARDLTALRPLLDLVDEAPSPPPESLRTRVLAATAGRRRLRRRVATLVAAALVAGALLGGVATITVWPGGDDETAVVELDAGEDFEAGGVARLRDTDAGLRVHLDLEGLPPLSEPAVYEAWLAAPDADEPASIGRFAGTAEGEVSVSLLADGTRDDYAYVWVTAEPDAARPEHEGPTVVAAPLHPEESEPTE